MNRELHEAARLTGLSEVSIIRCAVVAEGLKQPRSSFEQIVTAYYNGKEMPTYVLAYARTLIPRR